MRRRSHPESELRLPSFVLEVPADCSSELPSYSTESRSSSSTTKRGNGSMKVLRNIATTISVFALGYAASHMDDKSVDTPQQQQQQHSILGVNRRLNEDYDAQDDNIMDVVDEDDDFSNDDYWDHNLRNMFQANGLPLDHKPVMTPDDYTLVEDPHPFAIPDLAEFEMSPLYWASDGKQVDRDARLVGLPPKLTHEIRRFCEEIGLSELFRRTATSAILDIHDTIITGPEDLKEGNHWAITRAGFGDDTGSTNLHLLDAVDEHSFEETINVLERGLFDDVLDVIAAEFRPWGYMVAGMGFTVATHSQASRIHRDNPGGGKNFFNLIFPIHLPEHNVAQLYVGNEEDKKVAPLDLNYHEGLLVGADTAHGTADCDYRRDGSYRVFASIYIADIHEDNVDVIANDNTALFPIPGQSEWLLAQQGRFWGGTHGGSLEFDRGRKPFVARDELDSCPQLAERGLCVRQSDSGEDPGLWHVRTKCPKSCGIYIDDATYFSKIRPPPPPPPELESELPHAVEA